jgi:putative endonuclease
MTKDELGKWGEDFASIFLLQNGYSLVERNVRFKKYEVDIIAEKDDELIVVEVKARITAEIGEPWRAVTKSKQRQNLQTMFTTRLLLYQNPLSMYL